MRGAWIEISWVPPSFNCRVSLPMRGAWIEILPFEYLVIMFSRSPCGERGLKSYLMGCYHPIDWSLPMRGAWIEIFVNFASDTACWSLPMRGAWIEILSLFKPLGGMGVAPHAGSVD